MAVSMDSDLLLEVAVFFKQVLVLYLGMVQTTSGTLQTMPTEAIRSTVVNILLEY